MKLKKVVEWLDKTLNVAAFEDVSNNGLQVDRVGGGESEVRKVAFAVDASVRSVREAAKDGAQLLVVHHGISWGGGVKRLSGGVFNVVRAAMEANLAIYACHLPLDAHAVLGNNAQLAKLLGMKGTKAAFTYCGSRIGLYGKVSRRTVRRLAASADANERSVAEAVLRLFGSAETLTLGVCSGGAGEFAEEAKRLGCDAYLTGEASWGDVVAAENIGQKMACAGHYETEVFGIRALCAAMKRTLALAVGLALGG